MRAHAPTSVAPACGAGASPRTLMLSYGVADQEWVLARVDTPALLAALVPIRTEPGEVPEASAEAQGKPLPRRVHLFRGAPDEARLVLGS